MKKGMTVLVILTALGIGIARKGLRRPPEADPQDAVYAMLDAARAGDVKRYLASYTGATAAALRQASAESGAFAQYLRDSQATVKGVAVSDPEVDGDGEARVRVETVYPDRNQAQVMYLRKETGTWRIARVETEERVPTLIPYGTPVRRSIASPRP